MEEKQYLAIDQKSFYASVECVARGMDPMTTNLVVADPERSKKNLPGDFSQHESAWCEEPLPSWRYPEQYRLHHCSTKNAAIDCAAEIHGVFLRYFAPEDIYTYSIDESFIDVTPYQKMYSLSTRQLAKELVQDIREIVGTVSACGIGTNLYLAKIALDIQARHSLDFIGELNEDSYRELLWDHRPLTDFWRIGPGTQRTLRNHGITTLRDITLCDEELLYKWFGVDAELLIDHAWGREPTTIADIKSYKSKSKSLSSGQVLMRDYKYEEAEVIVKEMMDQLCLNMAAQKCVTDSVSLFVGYSGSCGVFGTGGSVRLTTQTNVAGAIVPEVAKLYRRITNPLMAIRRINLSCNDIQEDQNELQLNMFEDVTKQIRGKALQETVLNIRAKYGKNAILKGVNYEEAATGRERNTQIGGHRGGKNDY